MTSKYKQLILQHQINNICHSIKSLSKEFDRKISNDCANVRTFNRMKYRLKTFKKLNALQKVERVFAFALN